MSRVPSRALAAALLLLALSCSSQPIGNEWGAACSDGKDNDGDKLIDCADPDCSATPLCGGHPDGAADRGPDRRRDSLQPDKVAPREPVLPPGYGALCTTPLDLCPDGKTVCVPGIGGPSGLGYCTYPCTSGDPQSCPAAPAGNAAACVYAFNNKPYCAFLCKYAGQDYPCPAGMGCFDASPPQPYQKYCWPR